MVGLTDFSGSQNIAPGQEQQHTWEMVGHVHPGPPQPGCALESPRGGADARSSLRTTDLGEQWFE